MLPKTIKQEQINTPEKRPASLPLQWHNIIVFEAAAQYNTLVIYCCARKLIASLVSLHVFIHSTRQLHLRIILIAISRLVGEGMNLTGSQPFRDSAISP